MKKFFGWALFAALLGWTGASNAEMFESPVCADAVPACGTPCDSCQDCCNECLGNWFDNTYVWGGGDVYKSIGDRVTNIAGGPGALASSFGTVAGFNTGFALGDSNIRGQLGASLGLYDFRGRLAIVPQGDPVEEQVFVTFGAYKRGDMLCDCDPISWGVVADYFHGNQWGVNANTVSLAQVRGVFGYAVSECREFGVWGTLGVTDDQAQITIAGGGPLSTIRAMNQANFYVKQNFEFGGQVTAYIGVLDPADVGDWQFGVLGQAPLSCNWSLYGNFTYVAPSAPPGAGGSGEDQFNVSFGLAYYFGGKAVNRSISGDRGIPLLNVANNGSFLITD